MSDVYRIEMLPAKDGDSLWIEYGKPGDLSTILIDGGRSSTCEAILKKIRAMPNNDRHIELLVTTHIDADHIEGVIKLFEDPNLNVSIGDVWFNAWNHLPGNAFEEFGVRQGERLSVLLESLRLPWNKAFNSKAVSIGDGSTLPSVTLPGGMEITLLSPGEAQLADLRPGWADYCREEGLDPNQPRVEPVPAPPGLVPLGPPNIDALAASRFKEDKTEANGSSIAFLASFDDRTVLFAGDAHDRVLQSSLDVYLEASGEEQLELHAFKIPHHGSKANLSSDLVEKLLCRKYLISTSGARHHHPDKESVARIIKSSEESPELVFNYRTDENKMWDNDNLQAAHNYTATFPPANVEGITIEL